MSQLLSLKAVAQKLDVQARTVRKWIADGKLTGIKLPNGDYRFKEEHIENWLSKRTVKAKSF